MLDSRRHCDYAEDVRKLVNVPDEFKLVSIAVGLPDVGGISLAEKQPLDSLVFDERYQ